MSYTQGQRVCHVHGHIGTVAQDTPDHTVVPVLWNGATTPVQVLPECITPEDKQASASVRDAWTKAVAKMKASRAHEHLRHP